MDVCRHILKGNCVSLCTHSKQDMYMYFLNRMYADAFVFIQGKIWALTPNCVRGKCFVLEVLPPIKIFLKNKTAVQNNFFFSLCNTLNRHHVNVLVVVFSLDMSSLVCQQAERPANGAVYVPVSAARSLLYSTTSEHLNVRVPVTKAWVSDQAWVTKWDINKTIEIKQDKKSEVIVCWASQWNKISFNKHQRSIKNRNEIQITTSKALWSHTLFWQMHKFTLVLWLMTIKGFSIDNMHTSHCEL